MNIILADDNRNLCSALALVLETRLQPVELAFASNFPALLQRVNERQPDCIVLDCELPGFAGCLSHLRSISPDVKIIVFSARPED